MVQIYEINNTDFQVIQEVLNGNINAFENLVKKYEKKVYNLALCKLNSHEDAQDLTEKEIAALDAGADLYARWHDDPAGNVASVLAHITRLATRSQLPRPESNVIVYNKLLMAPLQHRVFVGNTEIAITLKEFDVLYLLMMNKECVFPPEQIYEEV